jgi:hypothetical protein
VVLQGHAPPSLQRCNKRCGTERKVPCRRRRRNNKKQTAFIWVSPLTSLTRYLPDGPTDSVSDVRVLILKDEAGRKDKQFLYDSRGEEVPHDGRYSPLPKRVQHYEVTDQRRTVIWKRLQSTCMARYHCRIKE